MMTLFRRFQKQVALPPGTVEYHGPKKAERVRISLMEYGPGEFAERVDVGLEDALDRIGKSAVTWINVDGLHETGVLTRIGEKLDIHPLVLEDIVNCNQRPKTEDFERYLYIVLRMYRYDADADAIVSEQISLILGRNAVASFQETEGDVFDPVRERIRQGKGRARRMGPSYLADILLDAVVDNYYVVLEKLGERIEGLEEPVINDPRPELLQELHAVKRDLTDLRKSVAPLREVIGSLARGESPLVSKDTQPFLRDVYDHTIHVIESVESLRDMLSGMQDLYMSSVSNRMNEVMKVLTIIATIFVPLTFVAGIYGMNFDVLPELKWKWGYLGFWIVSVTIGLAMVAFFRRKRWL